MIAFVTPWYGDNIPGGAEAALRGITDHLHEAGVEVEILTTTVEKFTADWGKNYYKRGVYKSRSGITVRRFAVRKRNHFAFRRVYIKISNDIKLTRDEEDTYIRENVNSPELYKYIRDNHDRYRFFVFIPYLFGTTYFGVQECLDKAVMIPCFHDENYLYMDAFKETFSKVAGMLFNAKPEAELTRRVYDLSGVKTEVMGLGLDTCLTSDADRFRSKYGINEKFILYAGRKDEGKNIYLLLAFFAQYKKTHNSDLKLVLIGGGEVKIPKEIKSEVIDLGFVDIQDKYDAYAAAELLCQPSVNESFSFVIMESWLCHRPVLVHNDCEVTKNFVKESNGGLYFRSYHEFEATVDYILDNPQVAEVMGENGRQYVLGHFAWDVIVKKYLNFFDELESSR